MIYSLKSKFNIQEIKEQLVQYLEGLHTDVQVLRALPSGYYYTHFFTATCIKTNETYYFRVSYIETLKWARNTHMFKVEFLSFSGSCWNVL